MIDKKFLITKYIQQLRSAAQIAEELNCSENKVHYWLKKYEIPKRGISQAVYARLNPNGDPFLFSVPKSDKDWFLYGLGLGLFWGEGNKVNRNAVRLGNTDPDLVAQFIYFLRRIFRIDENKLRFGLQLFSDTPEQEALNFWRKKLQVPAEKFQSVVVTPSVASGTYRKKNKYGVLTVYFSNTKLRDTIILAIDELRGNKMPL